MKKRGLIISVLVLLAVITSGFTYAFWAASVDGIEDVKNGSITIGTGDDITVDVVIGAAQSNTLLLVPTTITPTATQTNSVVFTYTITWTADDRIESVTTANIVATVSDILVGGVENPHNLIQVAIVNPGTVTQGSSAQYTFTVTMNEPASLAEYNDVAGKVIQFSINFEVNPIVA
jgi:hypothetical protein